MKFLFSFALLIPLQIYKLLKTVSPKLHLIKSVIYNPRVTSFNKFNHIKSDTSEKKINVHVHINVLRATY